MLNSEISERRNNALRALKRNKTKTLIVLLGGLFVLSAAALLHYFLQDNLRVFLLSVEILSWVLMWEAFDSFFFERPQLHTRYAFLVKLSKAKYKFAAIQKTDK